MQNFEGPSGQMLRAIIRDGEPWFVSSDITRQLEIENASDSIGRLDPDEHTLVSTEGIPGAKNPHFRVVSEAGMYSLILGSRKPEAKQFKRWVTHEVLPQIRKTGGYNSIPQSFADALQLAADQQRQIQAQVLQIEAARPAVAFMDEYVEAKSTRDISTVGKTLGLAPKAFFSMLSDLGVMFKRGGDWLPYQEHLDAGRFEVKTGTRHGHTWHQSRFTAKGVAWIAGRLS